MAQNWLIYRLTGSAMWLGVATFCRQVPVVLLATVGGLVADRFARRPILVATQSASMTLAFLLAGLTLHGSVRVAHVLAVGSLLGVINAIDSPTRNAFVIEMAGRDSLASAVAINSSMTTGAAVVGPALAGVAIKALGEGWCFLVNGVSFVGVVAALLAMRDLPAPSAAPSRESMRARLVAGFHFVAKDERARVLLALLALVAMMSIPSATLMPVIASKVLRGDAETFGWLMGAQAVGASIAGLLFASRQRSDDAYTWIGVSCAVNGATLVLLSLTRSMHVALLLMLPLGAATLVHVTATNALIQWLTPDALRGRVMAVWLMILMGFSPVGSVLAGWLASRAGPLVPLAAAGVLCLLGALLFLSWLARTRPSGERRTHVNGS